MAQVQRNILRSKNPGAGAQWRPHLRDLVAAHVREGPDVALPLLEGLGSLIDLANAFAPANQHSTLVLHLRLYLPSYIVVEAQQQSRQKGKLYKKPAPEPHFCPTTSRLASPQVKRGRIICRRTARETKTRRKRRADLECRRLEHRSEASAKTSKFFILLWC